MTRTSRRTTLRAAVLTAVAALAAPLATLIAPVGPAAAAATTAYDGSSMATAAASCWEIKQNVPGAANGSYWLVTPKLIRPQQFYCDMTTDGGGWVLIGRGREGWRHEYEGLGTTAEVRSSVDGPAAFRPRQLASTVVDGLLNGGRVDALADGVRLRRATTADGSVRQEVRFAFSKRDRWVWTFRGRHPIKSISFDGVPAGSGSSLDFGVDQAYRRVNTDKTQVQAWTAGFAYGNQVTGSTAAGGYLWSAKDGGTSPRPFTQMFIRPRLRTADLAYAQSPAAGLPAQTQRWLSETQAVPQSWGVAGLAGAGGVSTEMRTEVQAFAQIGDVMFVGGNFRTAQRDAAGSGQVVQSYLAAFDVRTGAFLPGFRPVLNEQVKALTALPSGLLAVGGEFTKVNGVPAAGVAVLDPATGQLASSFKLQVENRLTNGFLSVRSLKAEGGYLYLGGAFTHLTGGASSSASYARSAARVNAVSGLPDSSWNPAFNGTVTEVTPSRFDPRVYATGYFTASNSTQVLKVGAVSAAAGAAVIPWTPKFSVATGATNSFQFTVKESEDRVWVGGSEHSFFAYDRATLGFRTGGIAMPGGDFQTSVVANGIAYAGCHCDDYLFSGVTAYGWPSSFAQSDKLGWVGAFDATTGEYRPEFDPILDARKGYGAWASTVDSTGTLWIGGSFEKSVTTTGRVQWSGGFIRFQARDTTAPAAPAALTGAATDGPNAAVNLKWQASGPLESGADYEILAEGKVVARSTATSAPVPPPAALTSYVVRTVDAAGNRSASTPPLTIDPAAAPVSTTLVPAGSTWRWRFDPALLAPAWTSTSYDDSAWASGQAPLGLGSTGLGTTITQVGAIRPVTAQFRRTVSVADPATLGQVSLRVRADDGVVVYLNGVEIGRKNLPAGTLTQNTYATAAPRTTTAAASPLPITIPGTSFVAGDNVLAVQTHLNYRTTPDISVELDAVAVRQP